MWKILLDRPQMTKWHMHIACWVPKATNTHSEYVIHIAFPQQQWLCEHVSMLCYSTVPSLTPSKPPDWLWAPSTAYWMAITGTTPRWQAARQSSQLLTPQPSTQDTNLWSCTSIPHSSLWRGIYLSTGAYLPSTLTDFNLKKIGRSCCIYPSGKIRPIAIGKEAVNIDPTRRYAQEEANVTGIEHELPNSDPSHYTSWAIHAALLLER